MTKTVLITGVSSGIGKTTAELMASRGWQVVGTSRYPSKLAEWAAQNGVHALALEVRSQASIEAAVAATIERFGAIDVLVNNAGYGVMGPLEGTSPAEIAQQFETNVLGALAMIREVMPAMRARRSGTIVNVSSIGGLTTSPFASLYHATKYALEGFSESFRYEAALHGVRVKLVEPAHFKTDFLGRSLVLTKHEGYDAPFDNYMEWVRAEDRKAPGPEAVARRILQAAEDPSERLRYRVGGGLALAVIRMMPDAMWRSLLREGLTRRPKGSAPRGETPPG
jgi:NADP-dependent 3-hydroxy acid dehydrogenase YdfG